MGQNFASVRYVNNGISQLVQLHVLTNVLHLFSKLKLNSNKTEILVHVFSSSYCPPAALNNLVIASETVDCSTSAKNIGVIINNSLAMLPQLLQLYASLLSFIFEIFSRFARFNLMTYGGRFYTMADPSVWNIAPLELRSCCSLSSFKSKLKTLLFKASYDVVLLFIAFNLAFYR